MSASISRLAIQLVTDTGGLVKGFAQARSMVTGLQGSLAAGGGGGIFAGMGLTTAGGLAAAGAIGAVTTAAAMFIRTGVAYAANLEQLQISFEVMTGSAQKATAMLGEMQRLAAETPMSFQEVAGAGKILLAMGEDANAVVAEIKMLGDVAAGSGQPLGELAQVFGQVMQAGRLTGNELRQFNERGVPLLSQLSKQMGVSKMAIRQMVEDGVLGSDQVVQAFANMTKEGGTFANMMERQTGTLIGQWSKLKDNISIIAGQALAPLNFALKNIIEGMNVLLEQTGLLGKDSGRGAREQAQSLEKLKAQKAIAKAAQEEEQAAKATLAAHEKAVAAIASRADALTKGLRSPAEIAADSINELNDLAQKGLISFETYSRGIRQAEDALNKAAKASDRFKASAYKGVGAADKNTIAGFSAVQAGKAELQRMLEVDKQILIESKLQAKLQAETVALIKKQKPVVFKKGEL